MIMAYLISSISYITSYIDNVNTWISCINIADWISCIRIADWNDILYVDLYRIELGFGVAPPQSVNSSTEICIELEFGRVGFWGEGKTGVPGEKPPGAESREENQQQTQLTYCVESGNRSRATSVGGGCSLAIPTPTTAPSLLPLLRYPCSHVHHLRTCHCPT